MSTRDHSWGVRYDVGPPPSDLEPGDPLRGVTFKMIWSPVSMERPDGVATHSSCTTRSSKRPALCERP